ncbi:MAG: enoyl-CoA hydratase/isomerase family protein, partial [Pseudomonadales bacterium]|nr:enoyl-CoA hydratase/isomerase family protein [Pseudomonadales bacterium]
MDYEAIIYEVENNILTITLNRPEKLNAFNAQMSSEIINALDRADADDNVKAIIFTGQGRAFCAGADLSGGSNTFDYDDNGKNEGETIPRDGGGVLTLRLFNSLKPIISACNGPAVGVGATMQCAMDIRLASEKARYGFVFAKRGIVPEACSSWFLPRCVGINTALEWAYSGRIFDAQE